MEPSKYRLGYNPFDFFSHEHERANRKKEWEEINRCLESAFRGRGPRFLVLLGDYGMGKTYMLEQVYKRIMKERGDVFVAHRGVLTSRRVAIQESEPKWAKFGLNLVTRIFDSIGRKRLAEVLGKADVKRLDSKFLEVFEQLKNNRETAFKYLVGAKLSAKERRELRVDSALDDSPTSLELLFDFLRVVRLAGYANFLLLLDEFEYITAVYGETMITKILNTFRQIFDGCGDYEARHSVELGKPVFFFAISPGGWESLQGLEKAAKRKAGGGGVAPFLRRIRESDKIYLGPFSKADSLELVKTRLVEARLPKRKPKDPLFPFTRKCIEYVHEASFYKPGDVIRYCGILLDDALEMELERIDLNDTKRILRKYGIYVRKGKQ